ncbi:hypothetical protein [Corynebacterium sp. MSK158]|uniref:hypothetical protein n=1 Tax=Corynebacterium sp. MSK158 TaxID=3050212 RepID=UPI00254FD7FF|nr:hypothetical protein [Corynebacterium sp. MSK158]MDK8693573.1 hypothetical protein [Corynebacterium sp. MSK158]
MPTPYLIADSAQVTVLRSLASTAFGKYSVALPEGVDLEDVYEVSAPGNELAYVSSLGGKRRVGGMFRRFVRADVNITAQGEDMVPASDVERVLDDAAKRVSGDFFLESDITLAGLGPWVPMVDFQVGDIANVEIWGRVVPLAVTRIEPKRTDHSDSDWSIHVGGQLLSDSEARLAENTDIYNAVVNDRRELAGLDGKIRAETNNRKADVESVRGVLTGEGEGQEDLLASLAGLNKQLQETQSDPQPGLIPAYIAMNTRLWELQKEINAKNEEFQRLTAEIDAQQTEQIKQLQEVQKQQALESQGRIRELMATPGGTSDPDIRPTSRDDGQDGWQVKLTDMVGGSLFYVKWYESRDTTSTGGDWVEPSSELVRTTAQNSGSYTLRANPKNIYLFARWAAAEKKQVTVDEATGPWSVSRSTWSNVLTVNAPAKTAEQVALRLKVTWSAATYDDTYGIRIRAGGRVLQERMMEHLGPWSFLENGRRWMSVTVSNATVEPGEDITVDVYSTATLAGGRRVEQVELTGTWIEEV